MPASASGDVHLERRGTGARGPRAGTSRQPGSRRYAITAVSCSERANVERRGRASAPSPGARSSGGPPVSNSAQRARRAPRVARAAHRRRTWPTRRRCATATRAQPAGRRARPPNALRARRAVALGDGRQRARAPPSRRGRRSTSTSSVLRCRRSAAADSPTASSRRGQQRAELELVEQDPHLLAVPCAHACSSPGPTSTSQSRRSTRHLAVEEHPLARARRGSGAASAAARRGARRSPSRSP